MTLLVAANVGNEVWMVADAAITGGKLELRKRQFTKKIEAPSEQSLVGFSGDVHFGHLAMREISNLTAGNDVVEYLKKCTKSVNSVEFAYSYDDAGVRYLYKIAAGEAKECPTLHLGNHEAFEKFQLARHDGRDQHAPDAMHQLMLTTLGNIPAPVGLAEAVVAFFNVFAAREDHDVGGWPTPFVLNADGACLCPYAYSVTDPIVNDLDTGSLVPHGTAEAGGFALSFANYAGNSGMAIYWLQRRRGYIYRPSPTGYCERAFDGSPDEFANAAEIAFGERPHVWFGGVLAGLPDEIRFLTDEQGNRRLAVVSRGQTSSVGWIQGPADSFITSTSIIERESDVSVGDDRERLRIEASSDALAATLTDTSSGTVLELSAGEIDAIILELAKVRAGLLPPIQSELIKGATSLLAFDPVWRTEPSPHPYVPGAILTLRHNGLGWVGFLLPDHEQIALGRWLTENGERSKVGAHSAQGENSTS